MKKNFTTYIIRKGCLSCVKSKCAMDDLSLCLVKLETFFLRVDNNLTSQAPFALFFYTNSEKHGLCCK